MAASVWMKFSKVAMPRWVRPVALTMPMDTVWPTPSGLPMASTTSPTLTGCGPFSSICGRSSRAICSNARSVSGSVPTTRAGASRPSRRATRISSASRITW